MARNRSDAQDEAIAWRLRLRDGDAGEWVRLTAWLEADPENARAYALVARLDADAPRLIGLLPRTRMDAAIETANDNAPPDGTPLPAHRTARRRGIAGAALATT